MWSACGELDPGTFTALLDDPDATFNPVVSWGCLRTMNMPLLACYGGVGHGSGEASRPPVVQLCALTPVTFCRLRMPHALWQRCANAAHRLQAFEPGSGC